MIDVRTNKTGVEQEEEALKRYIMVREKLILVREKLVLVREKSVKSQEISFQTKSGHPVEGRNSKFGVWMHLGMVECHVPVSGHGDLDL